MAHRSPVLIALLLALLLAWVPAGNVHAAVFVVNSAADVVDQNPGDGLCATLSGQCTLRAAVMEANVYPDADTIILPVGTYTLSLPGRMEDGGLTGDLDVLYSLTITGAGGSRDGDPSQTVIQAGNTPYNGIDRVLSLNPLWMNQIQVTLEALTIRYGNNTSAVGSDGYGGGLDWEASGGGRLALYNMVITDNTADYGGGLLTSNESGSADIPVIIERSVFTRNTAANGDGGGLNIGYRMQLTMSDTTVRDNVSQGINNDFGSGGGIYTAGPVTLQSRISGSTFSDNRALGPTASGGGLFLTRTLLLNSTVSGNSAGGSGGGAVLQGAELEHVTVTNNRADADSNNGGTGGGLFQTNYATTSRLRNSLVTGNFAPSAADIGYYNFQLDTANCFGNLTGPASGGLVNGQNGNRTGITDARLGPLANNGGRTQTHALLAGSPALDAGLNAYTSATLDQRGLARRRDSADIDTLSTVDAGAYEAHPSLEDLSDRSMSANATLSIEFNFGDSSQNGFTFTPVSSNTTLVPNSESNIVVVSGSSSSTRRLVIAPAVNQSGSTTITLTASQGGLSTSESFLLTVIATPDLTVTKTHGANFNQGQQGAQYTLTVRNSGSGPTNGSQVSLVDTLPAGLSAVSMTGEGWTCSLAALTCTRSDILAASTAYPAVTLTVNVASNAPTSLTNTAAVSGGGDSTPANNSASDVTGVNLRSDLIITKTHTGSFSQGQSGAAYTLTVRNTGGNASSGLVTVTDAPPPGLTLVDLSGSGWTCTRDTLTCTRSTGLAAGASFPAITATFNVAATAPATLVNTAQVSGGGEINTTNNTASDSASVTQLPDLVVSKSHAGDFRQGQSGAVYQLVVSNTGRGATTQEVTLVDTLPAGLTAAGLSGTGWTCSLELLTCTRADSLAPDSSYPPVTLTAAVAAGAPAAITNRAQVSTPGEVVLGNNSAEDLTTVIQAADLQVSLSHAGNFYQGQPDAAFTLLVSNSGPGPTVETVSLYSGIPAGLTPVYLGGTGWTCSLGTQSCARSDPLDSGGSYPAVTLRVQVARNAPDSLYTQAAVNGGGELDSSNNSAADTAVVEARPDLSVSKSHSGDFRQGQTGASYTITAGNEGYAATSGTVSVTDELPNGLQAAAFSGDGWTCDLASLTCTRADALPAGQSYPPLLLTVNVSADAPPGMINTATVSGGGEVITTNNTALDFTATIQAADLVVSKSHVGHFVQGQTGAAFTLTVENDGPGDSEGLVLLNEILPAGLSLTAISGEGWTCDLQAQTCSRSDALAPGATYPPVQVAVTVAEDAEGVLTNRVEVSGGGELNLLNSSAEDEAEIYALPVITAQPEDLLAADGATASFSAAASGYPAPAVQWQVSSDDGSSWNDLSGQTAPDLALTAALIMDGWRYRAVFTNSLGQIESRGALLNIAIAPEISLHPLDQTVWLGEQAVFTAAAGGHPDPELQWQINRDGSGWQDLPGETGPQLAVTGSYPLNGARYRLLAVNVGGTTASAPARLTVRSFNQFLPLLLDQAAVKMK